MGREMIDDLLAARRAGTLSRERLEGEDLLVLGALADRVRREEVGPEVAVHLERAPRDLPVVRGQGLELLRAVAIARATGPKGARLGVDFSECGFEIAQVALGFGASELVGVVANKRGLPIAEDAVRKIKGHGMVKEKALKKKEIEGLVVRCQRTPKFAPELEEET